MLPFRPPFRGLYRPPGIARLNPEDPRTQGLIFCAVPDGASPTADLTGNFGLLTAKSGSPTSKQTLAGRGISFGGSGVGGVGPGIGEPQNTGSKTTILAVVVPGSNSVAGEIVAFGNASASTIQIALGVDGTNNFDWEVGTTFSGSFGQSFTPNVPVAVAATFASSGGSVSAAMYTLGTTKKTGGGFGASAAVSNTVGLGKAYRNGGFSANSFTGTVLLAAAWNAIPTDPQIWALLQDPFSFLIFPQDAVLAERVGLLAAKANANMLAMFWP